MEKNTIKLYNDKAYGERVSDYGLENGYLDYHTMAKIVGNLVLNNAIRAAMPDDWEIVTGEFRSMIFQDYIITEQGYEFLKEHTDETVFWNPKLNMYIWGISHFGTSWDYVLTNIKLEEGE